MKLIDDVPSLKSSLLPHRVTVGSWRWVTARVPSCAHPFAPQDTCERAVSFRAGSIRRAQCCGRGLYFIRSHSVSPVGLQFSCACQVRRFSDLDSQGKLTSRDARITVASRRSITKIGRRAVCAGISLLSSLSSPWSRRLLPGRSLLHRRSRKRSGCRPSASRG
jgi:hypothetical protein